MSTQRDRIEIMEAALREIEQWSRAYPKSVFAEPSPEDYRKAARALEAAGLTLDAITANVLRYALDGAGKIAREALAKAGST